MLMMPLLGDLVGFHRWRDELSHDGTDFGHFPNPSKTCLIVKPSFFVGQRRCFMEQVSLSQIQESIILVLL